MSNNSIYEYQEVKNKELVKYIIDNNFLHKYFSYSWGKIKAKQYCGITNHDKKDYYILPKIVKDYNDTKNLTVFTYILRYVYDIKIENLASSKK